MKTDPEESWFEQAIRRECEAEEKGYWLPASKNLWDVILDIIMCVKVLGDPEWIMAKLVAVKNATPLALQFIGAITVFLWVREGCPGLAEPIVAALVYALLFGPVFVAYWTAAIPLILILGYFQYLSDRRMKRGKGL